MKNLSKLWFSMIELLIWIFIFTLGLTWVYMLIVSTMWLNEYSKNSIVATNLAREWLEIVRNTRDTNYINLHNWNKLPWISTTNNFSTWVYYKVFNDFLASSLYTQKFEEITPFWEWESELNGKMQNYRLCLNGENLYTYDCSSSNKKTIFYRYIKFDDVKYKSWALTVTEKDALKVKSKVIWYHKWYHQVELNTIITDWQRL